MCCKRQSSATVDETKVQLNIGCDQNSSQSGNHSERSSQNLSHQLFAFPWLSVTFQDLGPITGLFRPGKCEFQNFPGLFRFCMNPVPHSSPRQELCHSLSCLCGLMFGYMFCDMYLRKYHSIIFGIFNGFYLS